MGNRFNSIVKNCYSIGIVSNNINNTHGPVIGNNTNGATTENIYYFYGDTKNNTYNSKSSSSKNKMSLDDIKTTLESRGLTNYIAIDHSAFNAGKTDLEDHKELLFLTKVGA